MLSTLDFDELRRYCKQLIETLELRLRYLVSFELEKKFGVNFFDSKDRKGKYIIPQDVIEEAKKRKNKFPQRYSKIIDACTFDELINIICSEKLFSKYFKVPLNKAFPKSNCHTVRAFLKKLVVPRNHLSHANPISIRQAEQVICYSNEILESLTFYFMDKNMKDPFNAANIIRFVDNHGHTFASNQMIKASNGNVLIITQNNFTLKLGQYISIEIEIDPTFKKDSYDIIWYSNRYDLSLSKNSNKISFKITEKQVGNGLSIRCKLIMKRNFHRYGSHDDELRIQYNVHPY